MAKVWPLADGVLFWKGLGHHAGDGCEDWHGARREAWHMIHTPSVTLKDGTVLFVDDLEVVPVIRLGLRSESFYFHFGAHPLTDPESYVIVVLDDVASLEE